MEREEVISLKKLIQNTTYNLHFKLKKIITSESAKNGQLNVVREEIETFFDEAWVQLIKLLGIIYWMVEHDREGLQTIEDCRKLMMQITSTKSFLVSASLELTNKGLPSLNNNNNSNNLDVISSSISVFDVNTAIDLSTTGTFQRMPLFPFGYRRVGSELNIGPQERLSISIVEKEMNNFILTKANKDIGLKWYDHITVKNGILLLSKKNEFDIELTLNDVRISSSWRLISNHCYIAEKKHIALPGKRPRFHEFCNIVQRTMQKHQITGPALLFQLHQQFPTWSIDKTYLQDAFLSNQFGNIIQEAIVDNTSTTNNNHDNNDKSDHHALHKIYIAAHRFCLQQAMKYIYLQVVHKKNKKMYNLHIIKNNDMSNISIIYLKDTMYEGEISCRLVENPFCLEEYDIKITNINTNDIIEKEENNVEELSIELTCINFQSIIVSTLTNLAQKRLNRLYNDIHYFKNNNKNNTIDENRLQIKMNSFHENLSVIIQFDQWTGKVYLHHTIHCDKRLWKKVKGIDAIILYNNDILSKNILPRDQINLIVNNLIQSLTKLLPCVGDDDSITMSTKKPAKKKRRRK